MNTFIRTIAVTTTTLAALGTFAAADAHAQAVLLPVLKPVRIKIGAYFPTSGDTQSAFGDTFFSLGASYDFNQTSTLEPIAFNIYATYADHSKNSFGSSNELTVFGAGVAARFDLAAVTPITGLPYIDFGLGYYGITASDSPEGPFTGGGGSSTNGRFGGKLALGYQFPFGFFGELEYDKISKVDSLDASGVGLNFGYRF